MATIRPARAADLEAVYRIALLTGDSGADASARHPDGRIVGDLFAAPYLILSPETCFVAEDGEGIGGYILGAFDTAAFEAGLLTDWWPRIRGRYPEPTGEPSAEWSVDDRWRWFVHHPRPTPERIARPFPSHLHIDLLPRLQGRGLGARMMDRWLSAVERAGSKGAHLGVSAANRRALRFYRAYGLAEPRLERGPPAGTVWFAIALPRQSIGSGPHQPGR